MVDTLGDEDARSGADLDRRLIVDHLLALARQNVDDLLSPWMVVAPVAATGQHFGKAEAVMLRPGNLRLAEDATGAPIERECFNVRGGRNISTSQLLHGGSSVQVRALSGVSCLKARV